VTTTAAIAIESATSLCLGVTANLQCGAVDPHAMCAG
jgi:hypothetical protein